MNQNDVMGLGDKDDDDDDYDLCSAFYWAGPIPGCLGVENRGRHSVNGELGKWNKAQDKLSDGNDLLSKTLSGTLSAPCQGDFDALATIAINTVGIVAISNSVTWNDAYNNEAPVLGLFVPGSPDYLKEQQVEGGETIGKYFADSPTRAVTA